MGSKIAGKHLDNVLSRIFLVISILIVLTWVWTGALWLWDWHATTSAAGSVWPVVWDFCKQNLSVIVVIYGLICLQVSGVAELKFEKSFLTAYVLSFFLTPPVMMVAYGRRKHSTNISEEKQ